MTQIDIKQALEGIERFVKTNPKLQTVRDKITHHLDAIKEQLLVDLGDLEISFEVEEDTFV